MNKWRNNNFYFSITKAAERLIQSQRHNTIREIKDGASGRYEKPVLQVSGLTPQTSKLLIFLRSSLQVKFLSWFESASGVFVFYTKLREKYIIRTMGLNLQREYFIYLFYLLFNCKKFVFVLLECNTLIIKFYLVK